MTSTAIAIRPPQIPLIQLHVTVPAETLQGLGKDPNEVVNLPFVIPQQPTQDEARTGAAVMTAIAALRTGGAVGTLVGAHWLGNFAAERGAPLLAQASTLDWTNPATLGAVALAGGAALLGAASVFVGVKTLLDSPRFAAPLWQPLGEIGSPELAEKAKSLGIRPKVYATQALAAVAAAGVTAAWFVAAPVVALGVGAAAAVGAFFTGRAAARAAAELQPDAVNEGIQYAARNTLNAYIREEARLLEAPKAS